MTKLARPNATTELPLCDDLALGQWYWVQGKEGRWLACVTHLGSNYVELTSAESGGTCRVHIDRFDETVERVDDPDPILDAAVDRHRTQVRALMDRVREVTRQLAVVPDRTLPGAETTQALVRASEGREAKEYKAALVLAKEKTLPYLFEQIKEENEALGRWMKAKLLPLLAEAERLKGTVQVVQDRVFHVELYAGLIEEVVEVRGGSPAAPDEKIRLMQRRCYMDEECLADYQVGGMEFKDIEKFDRWIAKKANMQRILPHSRCVVAFQVRRREKGRESYIPIDAYVNFQLAQADKRTFLYLRNGDRLYRLSTEVEFKEQLFSDVERSPIASGQKLWADVWGHGSVHAFITDAQREEVLAENARKQAEWDRLPEAEKEHRGWLSLDCRVEQFKPFTPESVYYDDIAAHVARQIAEHNRLVLVLQGLLDRSPVFTPHPSWSLWKPEDFARAVDLVWDDSRALTPGAAPDFEAYRARVNRTLRSGTVTVGQEGAWLRREAERENARRARDWRRNQHERDLVTFRPDGDDGPGRLARVVSVTRTGNCTFRWHRARRDWYRPRWSRKDGPVPCSIVVPSRQLLNADAYQPGDFRQFFADPRTRTDYLKWAPLLLEAEEYRAGNRKVGVSDEEAT